MNIRYQKDENVINQLYTERDLENLNSKIKAYREFRKSLSPIKKFFIGSAVSLAIATIITSSAIFYIELTNSPPSERQLQGTWELKNIYSYNATTVYDKSLLEMNIEDVKDLVGSCLIFKPDGTYENAFGSFDDNKWAITNDNLILQSHLEEEYIYDLSDMSELTPDKDYKTGKNLNLVQDGIIYSYEKISDSKESDDDTLVEENTIITNNIEGEVEDITNGLSIWKKYNMISNIGSNTIFILNKDNNFHMITVNDDVTIDSGKFILNSQGLYLNPMQSSDITVFHTSGNYIFGTELEGTVLYKNKAKNALENDGFLLQAELYNISNNIFYGFYIDGTATVTTTNGNTINYDYTVSNDGLITLVPKAITGFGYGQNPDYMFYDKYSNRIYRVVFELDTWTEYIDSLE